MEAHHLAAGEEIGDASAAGTTAPGSRLLTALPQEELQAIQAHLEPVFCEVRQILIDVNRPIEYVYFPEDCVISMVAVMRDSSVVEVATVGNEGVIGLPVFLRTGRTIGQAFCQVSGTAFRLPAEVFREAATRGVFNDLLHRYTQVLLTQISQNAACNRVHLTEERFARWLLMVQDRVGADHFALTQDFLSQMLGVRRATVSEVAAQAQDDGVIRYRRGEVTIVDRKRLEERSCECYSIVQAEFQTLSGTSNNALPRARLQLPRMSKGGKSTAGECIPHLQRPTRRARRRRQAS